MKLEGNEGNINKFRLTHYFALFGKHVMLKHLFVVWNKKLGNREARWNESIGELDNLLDAAPFPTLVNHTTYYYHLIIYQLAFSHF
jgi:hypothetical protein